MNNILISSVGRQSFLTKEFQKAIDNNGRVVVCDYNQYAKAFEVADSFYTAPAYTDNDYIPWLLDVCKKESINLLLTLNVDELLILEKNRNLFSAINCFIVGGDLELIKTTYDKHLLYEFCKKINIDTPPTYLLNEIIGNVNVQFPIIAKPRIGKGSKGNFIIKNENELKVLLKEKEQLFTNESYIFQELIRGDEYGVDLINDFDSHFQTVFVRKKLEMKNGETYEAITSSSEKWIDLALHLSKELKHQGIIDLDFLVLDKKKYLIDINYRFGGGYIFSHMAGAELPRVFVNWLLDKAIDAQWLNPKENIHSRREDLFAKIISDGK
jgi:carbamoyl-phosphate synthase large subunit